MIELHTFATTLKEKKMGPLMGVPCSVFKDFLNYVISEDIFEHYACSSEGESMGLAAGFALAGKYPVVYMQNDGLGNAINPLSSLQLMYELPALLLVSWRGEPEKNDAPQHKLMGSTLIQLLSIYKIPHSVVTDVSLEKNINNAESYMKEHKKPYALIFKKGLLEKYTKELYDKSIFNYRYEYLDELQKHILDDDIVLGTTGFTGRELYQKMQHKSKFYMMGSMGCLPSLGLGLAISFPQKRVFILDGDGALLMKLGSLATLGYYQSKNIIHICFDNNLYESTGGQKTTSDTTNFADIAYACSYKTTIKILKISEFRKVLSEIESFEKPIFLHVKIRSGSIKNLTRPSLTPVEMKTSFIESL